MSRMIAVVLLTIGLAIGLLGQDVQKKVVPPECRKQPVRIDGPNPKGPFKILPKESYKRSPTIRYEIHEDGSVSNVTVIHSSGVIDIDRKWVDAIGGWKYKPRPLKCGVIETEMTVTIDWAYSR